MQMVYLYNAHTIDIVTSITGLELSLISVICHEMPPKIFFKANCSYKGLVLSTHDRLH